jgi:hypothetical protein
MENNLNQTEETSAFEIFENAAPKIYSKQAIFGFCIVFTSIFGGVLLMQNLRDIGKKKEANLVLLLSILYTALVAIAANTIAVNNSSVTWVLNAVGGAVLSEYFYKKYFPADSDYPKKTIWKPLIISLIIVVPFILAAIYANDL